MHVSHEDCGFRKNKILNDAIKITEGEKLVFIDGDCILHRKFLEMYNLNIKRDAYYYARRVMLSERMSNKLLSTKNVKNIIVDKSAFFRFFRNSTGDFFPVSSSHSKGGQGNLGM